MRGKTRGVRPWRLLGRAGAQIRESACSHAPPYVSALAVEIVRVRRRALVFIFFDVAMCRSSEFGDIRPDGQLRGGGARTSAEQVALRRGLLPGGVWLGDLTALGMKQVCAQDALGMKQALRARRWRRR
eukprot:SAG31_NODE_1321_length_8801_cov_7.086532_6_plen_129_part_00